MSAQSDRDDIVRTGCRLLTEIKKNGGTAKELAELLRVSPSRISHWNSNDPDRIRRVGAPTESELATMTSYLCFLARRNLEGLEDLVSGGGVRHWYQMQLLAGLAEFIHDFDERWESIRLLKAKQVDEMIDMLKELQKKQSPDPTGLSHWRELFGRFASSPFMGDHPDASAMAMEFDINGIRPYLIPSPKSISPLLSYVEGFMADKEDKNSRPNEAESEE